MNESPTNEGDGVPAGANQAKEEAELLDRARSREPRAIAELYRQYGDTVYQIAYRLSGSADDAEDALQDVFVGLPMALESYEGRGSLLGWIKKVAARTTLIKLRNRARRAEVAIGRLPLPSVEQSTTARIDLEQAVAALPEVLRTVFVLKEVEGYSHLELGQMLGITEGLSRIRLHRAKKQLQKLLGESQ